MPVGRVGLSTVAPEPVFIESDEREWETWPAELVAERGRIVWQTLLSADRTPTDSLTLGIAALQPGEALHEHRHAQAELYFILSGEGEVVVDGERRPARAGTAIFFPGDARHGVTNTGSTELRYIYVFAADSFADVDYVFET
jgi:mannose-6-phosphate isomerase-like protein (cupin superfamily)